jgi:hypothetical protein
MNAVVGFYRDEMDVEVDSAVNQRRDRMTLAHRSRRPEHRRNSAPASVNGIHRRRNKRWTWGSGRGSRMMSLRAMASGLALALAGLAGSALAGPAMLMPVTIDYATVGNPGNVALNTGTYGPRGSVSETFNIAKYETSNADYVKFLNTVDPSGTNPNSIYNAAMTSDATNGGILNTGTVDGARYSVRSVRQLAQQRSDVGHGGDRNGSLHAERGHLRSSGGPQRRCPGLPAEHRRVHQGCLLQSE